MMNQRGTEIKRWFYDRSCNPTALVTEPLIFRVVRFNVLIHFHVSIVKQIK